MKVAFVVAGNGFGHLKRVLEVTGKLFDKEPSTSVHIFGATAHEEMLKKWSVNERFRKNDFVFVNAVTERNLLARVSPSYSVAEYEHSLLKIIQLVHSFNPDRIVSDNLVGILREFPDTLLMGSFLFPDTLFPRNESVRQIIRTEEELLTLRRPVMLGVAEMVMPYVMNHTQFQGLPWFCTRPNQSFATHSGVNVLVTGGGTGNASAILKKACDKIGEMNEAMLWVDPKLKEVIGNNNTFDFSAASFQSLDWIIGRPGIGILTDAVAYGIPYYAIYEEDKEMKHNAACVEALGIGFDFQNHSNQFMEEAVRMDTQKLRMNLLARPVDGATAAAKFILNS